MARKTYSGKFIPRNLEKYKGNFKKIEYRSSWELFMMKYFDNCKDVVKWNSEEVIIPYRSTADGSKDGGGKLRRYFMDFWVKYENGREFLIEVKPYKETIPPVPPKRKTAKSIERYQNEVYTYTVNIDKWKAAEKLAIKQGIIFRLVTEKSLPLFGWRG